MSSRKPTGTAVPCEEDIEAAADAVRNMKARNVVLSFDMSTTCVGWALGVDHELVKYGKYVFKTTAEIGEKLLAFEKFVATLLHAYNPNTLVLEETVSRKGSTTRRHSEMTGILRKCWREHSGKELLKSWIISSKTVKTKLRVPRGKDHDHNKAIMVKRINQLLGLNLQYNKNSAYKSDDDIADAIAVLFTYWKIHLPDNANGL